MLEHDIVAEPLEGYRIFRLDPHKSLLISVARNDVWLPGEPKQSVCRGPHGIVHEPHEKCTCGIHAAKSRKKLQLCYPGLASQLLIDQGDREGTSYLVFRPHDTKRTGFVSARVRLWGHTIQHENGYRAQWGEIIGHTIQWWPRRGFKHHDRLLHHLREKYGNVG